ncbi:MAG: 4-hydroxy-tetrahydrodipicolinate reductase [Bacteroidaceae bacterium]|jgi:4-hydroxy-tetrahydrodipicolinate reductase|nr:4-hydroxy-tetrahydrodipicolinate reductase [Bacteroidaceae bacterium]MEA5099115.1 4-hydroxy-tetrahydrodipicolinate reductase [Bacteroidales bacterium]
MNILLIGYGKMGKMIEDIALLRNHNIAHVIDKEEDWDNLDVKEIDVAIDFSSPYTVVDNIVACFNRNIPIVVGTTGWYGRLNEFRDLANQEQKGLFVASNFSIGMSIFNKINEQLAILMNAQPSYDVSIEEIHHVHKLDAPSGTAITLAETIIDNLDRKTSWELDCQDEKPNVINVTAQRIGEVSGTHSVTYSSEVDDIIITHQAHNRKGFALGAVLAAEFMKGKTGFYGMKDLIK